MWMKRLIVAVALVLSSGRALAGGPVPEAHDDVSYPELESTQSGGGADRERAAYDDLRMAPAESTASASDEGAGLVVQYDDSRMEVSQP
jgi:hypothetical protein